MRTKRFIVIILILLPWYLPAQVLNDNIEDRHELNTDGTNYISNTDHCTVQKECVDQSLTGKCVQYHNDQWFYFNSGDKGNLFINIYNQSCRDIRGVQLIVMQGTPCEPSTYVIKACVSLANQDNIFLYLDSLDSNSEYLINVDGYLHDFCEFTIEVGPTPKGIPTQHSPTRVINGFDRNENFVNISWTVSESDTFQHYQIFRWKSNQASSESIAELPHQRNARGSSKLSYSYIDTLTRRGSYNYKIVGSTSSGMGYLLAEKQITITKDVQLEGSKSAVVQGKIEITLDYKEDTPLTVLLINRDNQQILARQDFQFDQESDLIFFFVEPFLKKGITRFEVRVLDLLTNSKRSYMFGGE